MGADELCTGPMTDAGGARIWAPDAGSGWLVGPSRGEQVQGVLAEPGRADGPIPDSVRTLLGGGFGAGLRADFQAGVLAADGGETTGELKLIWSAA